MIVKNIGRSSKNIYDLLKILGNYESSTGSAHYYSESRHHGEAGAEMAELSPGYSHGGYADPAAEEGAETSGSGSAEDGSGSEETDEEGAGGYEGGKRAGGPLSGLAAKKRRKQTAPKPIRLDSEGEAAEGAEAAEAAGEGMEDTMEDDPEDEEEDARYRRGSGASVEQEAGQGDTQPLNLSAVTKHADTGDKAEAGGE